MKVWSFACQLICYGSVGIASISERRFTEEELI